MVAGSSNIMSVPVMSGTVLGVTVLRGYAPLCELARISKADVYDQKHNPTGTQRDLSPKHARNAYEYIRSSDLGYWPEVFLSVRSPEVMEYLPPESDTDAGTLKIDRVMVEQLNGIAISRVDGNHRLHYADGTHKGFPLLIKWCRSVLRMVFRLSKKLFCSAISTTTSGG